MDDVNRHLAHCARIDMPSSGRGDLSRGLAAFSDWDALLSMAESHGLGPLVYFHLKACAAAVPTPVWHAFHGLYLRHRQANRLRMRALSEILAAFDSAGVPARVLKGAALAHLIYPEPGLRPLSDLDLLVKSTQIQAARQILADLGYAIALPGDRGSVDKHVALVKTIEGLVVCVELHHNLFPPSYPTSIAADSMFASPLPFKLGEQTAYALSREAMLWHLCQHLVFHTNVFLPLRLIWIADIVSMAERFVAEIDWELVRQRYPLVLNVLSLLHDVTPLSAAVQDVVSLGMKRGRQEKWGDFHGWPRTTLAHQRRQGMSYYRILQESLFPANWWLRLHYGLSGDSALYSYRLLRHPWHILGWVTHLFRGRTGFRVAT